MQQLLSEDCPDPETAICKYSPITAFAPTNDAFDQLASDLGVDVEGLLALPEVHRVAGDGQGGISALGERDCEIL